MSATQKITIIFVTIFFIALTTASALLAIRAWDPLWNPFRPSQEKILLAAFQKRDEIKTLRTEAIFTFDLYDKTKKIATISARATNRTDQTDSLNPKSEGALQGEVMGEGTQISFAGEYKFVDKSFYFKITTLPLLPFLQIFINAEALEQMKSQWIVFDTEELGYDSQLEPTRELRQKILDAYERLIREGELFSSIEQLSDKTLRGASTYHFKMLIANAAIKEMYQLYLEDYATDDPLAKTAAENLLERIGDIPIELWIEKEGLYPYRLTVQTNFPSPEATIKLALQMDFSNFNIPLSIQPPDDAKTFEEILQSLDVPGSPLQQARSQARDARRQADIRLIQTGMELYHNDFDRYLSSPSIPLSLGNIIPTIPSDPGSGVCEDYQWIPNAENPQSYCLYACLEDGRFFVGSPRGTFIHPIPPFSFAECES
ncbi:MAG TPA: hypothetical protein DIS53_03285 [Candidatus Wildermuthbacteria bacterium]|uniref:Uncharacterized protein n=1 Tax=Candidatus Yanofskybacteria bacterium GW2011_GWC1_48_11 TaxID=1619027 RepID=A0A837IP41_9BACT|nr:MAG: hypothetical protein UY25_C0002G0101 [Candidatus Yanofskybacteria bacterium GW2011_GWC1_48_11]KKW04650.1 MAG: hypothetical protein UY38_C0001G0217 [Parcubacteria group bacterium GW2011_GWB1_49_12]KKW09049.1 MAG: hypothetical protein UY45_C0002G0101 [Parcubacteria group bacterium GW2011_GWA1_49_26]KKW13638.1 MAG: hypothetical protein UY53_C0010G0047 [Parcubacteria group bacterium GW2011_GWA2_50_10]OHA61098.1 MAG: hypothetical protein A2109_02505 [Candidatus Wildermuthbacteria bacterium G